MTFLRKCLSLTSQLKNHTNCRNISTTHKLFSNQDNFNENDEEEHFQSTFQLSSVDAHRVDMKPFMKEMFKGNFWNNILSYPEVLPNDRYMYLEDRLLNIRQCLREHSLENIEKDNHISKELWTDLNSLEMFGLRGVEQFELSDETFCLTESLRLIEEVANYNFNVSNVLVNSYWYGAETIRKYASHELQQKYLPSLYTGESICALCITDTASGSDLEETQTEAVQNADGTFTLNGDKSWVTNAANADIFLVWAKVKFPDKHQFQDGKSTLCAFLVDAKESTGIKVDKNNLYPVKGLKASGITSVKFENVKVSVENQLCPIGDGASFRHDALKDEAKLVNSVQILAGLRRVLNTTFLHASTRKAFDSNLLEKEMVQYKIAECCLHFFALESSIYMTAGLADYQQNPDFCLEATACKVLAAETHRLFRHICKLILGGSTYLSDNPTTQILNDIEGLNWWESNEDLNKLYIGLTGLSYASEDREIQIKEIDHHRKNHGGGLTPLLSMGLLGRKDPVERARQIRATLVDRRFYNLKRKFHKNVHPTLHNSAVILEKCFEDFDNQIEMLLFRYGVNIQRKELQIERLAKAATYLYAMTSTLARATRSCHICNTESTTPAIEVNYADCYIQLMEKKVRMELYNAECREAESPDGLIFNQCDETMSRGKYPSVHPINKSMF